MPQAQVIDFGPDPLTESMGKFASGFSDSFFKQQTQKKNEDIFKRIKESYGPEATPDRMFKDILDAEGLDQDYKRDLLKEVKEYATVASQRDKSIYQQEMQRLREEDLNLRKNKANEEKPISEYQQRNLDAQNRRLDLEAKRVDIAANKNQKDLPDVIAKYTDLVFKNADQKLPLTDKTAINKRVQQNMKEGGMGIDAALEEAVDFVNTKNEFVESAKITSRPVNWRGASADASAVRTAKEEAFKDLNKIYQSGIDSQKDLREIAKNSGWTDPVEINELLQAVYSSNGRKARTGKESLPVESNSPEFPDSSNQAPPAQVGQVTPPFLPGISPQASSAPQAGQEANQRTPASLLADQASGTPKQETAPKQEKSLFDRFSEGLNKSASGKIAEAVFDNPAYQKEIADDPGFWESLVTEAGTVVGDLPYLAAGATLGGALGTSTGALTGPFGAAAGGILGAGFGSLALPKFLKEAISEYQDFQEKGGDLTFGEFLQSADKVASKTLNEGMFGAILGMVSKAAPMLEKIPGIGKLFTSKFGAKAGEVGLETAAMGTIPGLSEGRLPTSQEYAHALATSIGLKLAHVPSALAKQLGITEQVEKAKEKESKERPKEQSKEKANEEVKQQGEVQAKLPEGKASKEVETPKKNESPPEPVKTSEKKEPSGITEAFSNMGQSISNNFYRNMFKALKSGKAKFSGDSFMESAKVNYDKGLIKSEADLRKFRKVWDEKFNNPVDKNIQAIEKQIQEAEKKGDSAKVQILQKNLKIQKAKKNQLKKKVNKPVQPITEDTGKSADDQIDVPKTLGERFIEKTNQAVDAIKNPGRTLSNTGKAINENIFNFLAPLERLESNIPVEKQVTSRIKLAQSANSTINSIIENGIFSDVGNRLEHGGLKEAYGDYTWKRLTRKANPGEYSIQEIDAYRTSKQALKRQKEGKKTGIGTVEATRDVAKLAPKYERIDAAIREYNKAVTATYGKDTLGKKLIDLWNSDYHTSLYRVMDNGEGSMLSTGSLEPKKSFFEYKGSTRKVIPPSESDIYNTSLMVQNSKKNDAVLQYKKNVEAGLLPGKVVKSEKTAKMPKELMDKLEVPEELQDVADNLYAQTRLEAFTPSKHRLRGWEDGVPFEIEVPSDVVEVFKGLQPINQGAIAKVLNASSRAFSKGLTLDARKFFSIHARDAVSAMIYSREGVTPMDTAKVTAEVLGNSDLFKQFKFDGGDMYASRLSSRVDRATKINEAVTPGTEGPVVPLNKLYGWFKKYEKTLGDISMAVPYAEYKKALEKYGNTAEGRILAMMEAKKVTYDPTRKGKSRLVREIAPFMNFWNVTLQDIAMVGENLKRPEVWARGILSVSLPSLALKMWNEGNPAYDDLTPLDKASYWHLYFGDTHLRVAIPWLLGTVFKVIPETMYDSYKGRTEEGMRGLYENAVDQVSGSFNPLIQTSIELMTGKSPASPVGALLGVDSKSPDVIPRRLQGLPKEAQYDANTSQFSRNFAPLIGVSPAIMDRIVSNLGANVGRDALALMDEIAYQTGMAQDKRPDKQLSNYLVLGNFVSTSPPSRTKYAEEFYRNLEALRVAKAGEKRGIPASDIKRLEKANLTKYNTEINKRFKKYREIQESDNKSDIKKAQLDRLQKEINALYKKASIRSRA